MPVALRRGVHKYFTKHDAGPGGIDADILIIFHDLGAPRVGYSRIFSGIILEAPIAGVASLSYMPPDAPGRLRQSIRRHSMVSLMCEHCSSLLPSLAPEAPRGSLA